MPVSNPVLPELSKLIDTFFTSFTQKSSMDDPMRQEALKFIESTMNVERTVIDLGYQINRVPQRAAIIACKDDISGKTVLDLGEQNLKHGRIFLNDTSAELYVAVDISLTSPLSDFYANPMTECPHPLSAPNVYLKESRKKFFKRPTYIYKPNFFMVNVDYNKLPFSQEFDFLFSNALTFSEKINPYSSDRYGGDFVTTPAKVMMHLKPGGFFLTESCRDNRYLNDNHKISEFAKLKKEYWILHSEIDGYGEQIRSLKVYGLHQKL